MSDVGLTWTEQAGRHSSLEGRHEAVGHKLVYVVVPLTRRKEQRRFLHPDLAVAGV